MTSRLAIPAFTVLVALAVAGCGGGSTPGTGTVQGAETPGSAKRAASGAAYAAPDAESMPTAGLAAGEQGVREVFHLFNQALVEGNSMLACSLLTSVGKRKTHEGYNITCEDALTRFVADLDEHDKAAILDAKPTEVTMDGGDMATARSDIPKLGNYSFIRRDGRWYINNFET